jgi:hypothetical protein
MAEPSTAGNPIPRGPNLRRVLLLDIVLPVLTVFLLERNGVAALPAYAAASFFPIASVIGAWLRQRSVDVIGIGVVFGVGSGLLLGLVTADPRFALVRAAPGFALFGIACLISLATARPLMFFVARAFAAGGDAARVAAWNQRLGFPRFHATMRRLTLVWGVTALIAASLGIACAFLLPGQVALIAEPLVAFGAVGALLAWTRSVQRRAPPVEPILVSPEEHNHA